MGAPIKVVPKADSFYDNYDMIFGSKKRRGFTLTSSSEKFVKDWAFLRNLLLQEEDLDKEMVELIDSGTKIIQIKIIGE